ncbi:DUF6114 domain-containing protein [Nocardiopsis valliformis]|uniref:DUF6114 domain-containing protein n=1 Tax=Nocardiopsis valliformis TaxID=239974 RepID=UPI00034BCF88|nr:DUF6114 domain-containing protein [Nocardiopsis valliformis]
MLLSGTRNLWARWTRWRKRRPFLAGLLMILAGIEMVLITQIPVQMMIYLGVGAVSTLVFSGMLIVLGLITWFTPNQHMITGSFAGFIALGALILSNLGGLVIGTLLALAGGGLAFAWRPVARPPRKRRGRRRRRAQEQERGTEESMAESTDQTDRTEPLPPVARSEG